MVPLLSSTVCHHTGDQSSSSKHAVPVRNAQVGPHGQPSPHVNPRKFQSRDMARVWEERREEKYKDKMCTMCCKNGPPVYHTHFSTASVQRFVIAKTKSKTFLCPICKVPEPVVSPISESRRILLTCSTMYGAWDQANLPSTPVPIYCKDGYSTTAN